MMKKMRLVGVVILAVLLSILFYQFINKYNFAVFDPQGTIAFQERRLIFATIMLSLLVVLPVFGLTIFIAWNYRQGNTKAKYKPHWDHDSRLEFAWWAVPIVIISVLAAITIKYTYMLDPYKPLQSDKKPLTIQVVALQWQWLFIYPEQRIASTNQMPIPIDRPINLLITSDAPMNSIWIPQLSGQIYAMSGMTTQLHLNARKIGTYKGSSANLSGEGFANMKFNVVAKKESDFNKWIKSSQNQSNKLNYADYINLAKPTLQGKVAYYHPIDDDLYDRIIMKYMSPASHSGEKNMESMNHAR